MKYAVACATLLIQSFICAMGEQIPLLSLPPVVIQPVTDHIRYNIESKLNGFESESAAMIIKSINTHTRGNGIQWDAVIKDLEAAPRRFRFVPLKFALPGYLTTTAIDTAGSIYGMANIIFNKNLQNNLEIDLLCIAPNLASGLASASVAIFLLMELMNYKQYFLLKSPEFKQLLNDIDKAQSSDQLLQLMSHKNNFSKSEQRLLQHAQDSSLLSDGNFHSGAFKFALKDRYPLSHLMFSFILGTIALNSGSGFCMVPDHLIIGFAPLFFNMISLIVLQQLLSTGGEFTRPRKIDFSEIIRTIRDDLAITQVNVINEDV